MIILEGRFTRDFTRMSPADMIEAHGTRNCNFEFLCEQKWIAVDSDGTACLFDDPPEIVPANLSFPKDEQTPQFEWVGECGWCIENQERERYMPALKEDSCYVCYEFYDCTILLEDGEDANIDWYMDCLRQELWLPEMQTESRERKFV